MKQLTETQQRETHEKLLDCIQNIQENLEVFKKICRDIMSPEEYNQFKYRTLGHIEPVVYEDSEWSTKYASLDSLEEVAERFNFDESEEDDNEEP
jgi:hypothetical protein